MARTESVPFVSVGGLPRGDEHLQIGNLEDRVRYLEDRLLALATALGEDAIREILKQARDEVRARQP